MRPVILFIVNPGSTSTKTALFSDMDCLFEQKLQHTAAEVNASPDIIGQLTFRMAAIDKALEEATARGRIDVSGITAFVGRGGLVHSVPSGTYLVNEDMLLDLREARYGEHASNLGAVIAAALGDRYAKPAYIADPPPVDEMISLARYAGTPLFRRKSTFHALNQKAVARKAAESLGKPYEQCSLIVAHLGGGISVGAHLKGRVIDVNNALEEGPFSPERVGTAPALQLVDLCFSGRYDKAAIVRLLVGQGGLVAYTGTTDCRKIEDEAAQKPEYKELLEAMAYQVAKSIGALTACLGGAPDAIALTGGLAHSGLLTGIITERVKFLGPVLVFPGENEMEALATRVRRVLSGEEPCLDYVREPRPEKDEKGVMLP